MACGKTDIAAFFLSGGFGADPDFLCWEVACACCMVLPSINLSKDWRRTKRPLFGACENVTLSPLGL